MFLLENGGIKKLGGGGVGFLFRGEKAQVQEKGVEKFL